MLFFRAAAGTKYPWQVVDLYDDTPEHHHHDGYQEYYPVPYPTTPTPHYHCPQYCDLTDWPECQCLTMARDMYTYNGRGNCNVGALKPDLQVGGCCVFHVLQPRLLQVWCFVNPDAVCPDMKESTVMPGKYWSRFACITE